MENPKISVVIPAYNSEKYIGATLDSLINQTFSAHEIIVVDDGSVDETAEVVSRYPQIRLIQQRNQGVSAARNNAVRQARGDWIAFIDSDDIWHPEKLRLYRDAIVSYPRCYFFYSEFVFWPADEAESGKIPEGFSKIGLPLVVSDELSGWIYHQQLLTNWVLTSTAMLHKELFFASGMFDIELPVAEDWSLFIRASRLSQAIKIRHPLTLYRQSANSLTTRVRSIDYPSLVVDLAIRRYGKFGPDGTKVSSKQFRQRAHKRHFSYAYDAFVQGYFRLAFRSFGVAICYQPFNLKTWIFWIYLAIRLLTGPSKVPHSVRRVFDPGQ